MEKKSNHAIIGIIIIILILVIGGYFLYQSSLKNKIETEPNNDLSVAEQELNTIDLEGLDQEI